MQQSLNVFQDVWERYGKKLLLPPVFIKESRATVQVSYENPNGTFWLARMSKQISIAPCDTRTLTGSQNLYNTPTNPTRLSLFTT